MKVCGFFPFHRFRIGGFQPEWCAFTNMIISGQWLPLESVLEIHRSIGIARVVRLAFVLLTGFMECYWVGFRERSLLCFQRIITLFPWLYIGYYYLDRQGALGEEPCTGSFIQGDCCRFIPRNYSPTSLHSRPFINLSAFLIVFPLIIY